MRWLLAVLFLGYAGCVATADIIAKPRGADPSAVVSNMIWSVHDGDVALIHMGDLAKTRAGMSVRALAGGIADRHREQTADLIDLRREIGLGESTREIDLSTSPLVGLAMLNGEAFDKAYLIEAKRIINDQRGKIGVYSNYAGGAYPWYWTIAARDKLDEEAGWIERWRP